MANATKNVLSFDGFDDLIDRIKKANGDAPKAAKKAVQEGAAVYHAVLYDKCKAAGVPDDLLDGIEEKIEADASGERITATVGWRLPQYDPTNPADGYKVIFFNYGTARREVLTNKPLRVRIDGQWKTLNRNHKGRGAEIKRGFIGAAKKAAKKKIKQAEENALNSILKDLEQ